MVQVKETYHCDSATMKDVMCAVRKERKVVVMGRLRTLLICDASERRGLVLIFQKWVCSMTRCSNKKIPPREKAEKSEKTTKEICF